MTAACVEGHLLPVAKCCVTMPTAADVYLHRTKPKNLCQRASFLHSSWHWFFKGVFFFLIATTNEGAR